ncbi:MAG: hypothetical protein ACTS8S_19510, partial [Giesbergeria sp.]
MSDQLTWKTNNFIPMIANDIVFRAELKAYILAAVDQTEPPDVLRDDEPWFGPESRLDLDSL